MNVVIGIPTYRRPQMLALALESVKKLEIPDGVSVSVVVADNNPDASAAAVVNAVAQGAPMPMRSAHEPRRGISSARNRLLTEAAALNADWVAFFDDDETVRPDWLTRLLAAAETCAADVVVGPVNTILPDNAPAWTATLYRQKPRRTGDAAQAVATSNVLFSAKLPQDWGLRFDERLNLAGSEDVAFFDEAAARGARMVWCADAWVDEPAHPERLTRRAVFLRYLGGASSAVAAYRLRHGKWAAATRYLPRAFGKLFSAFWFGLKLIVAPNAATARFLGHAGTGVGMFVGLAGMMHQRYRTVQGG